MPAYAGIPNLKPSPRFPGAVFTRAGLEDAVEFERLVAYLLAAKKEWAPEA